MPVDGAPEQPLAERIQLLLRFASDRTGELAQQPAVLAVGGAIADAAQQDILGATTAEQPTEQPLARKPVDDGAAEIEDRGDPRALRPGADRGDRGVEIGTHRVSLLDGSSAAAWEMRAPMVRSRSANSTRRSVNSALRLAESWDTPSSRP